ncbi:thiamine phosphate synthase [Lysinibacillus sp. BW-2-10]|uniref:thiamine phosphate synthase n=1 Tax=Lysinibacillus sp. BW-2-10 TaxID=2590030 RepID=UPI00117E466D|nr:thiamine phosphate synthase [Lysinibacillus sp. BW-2-10]TSI02643.1 thiamine phosphate synthase [Lysinibacillus sp. BW-2-10]
MLICVTNRTLCQDNFLERIEQIARSKPYSIMLREKDLNLQDYETLAKLVFAICEKYDVPLIINQNITVAEKLNVPNIHLSMPNLRKYKDRLQPFLQIGASVHSVSEAVEAQNLGATYVVAGHIYSTNSKKDLPPRGLCFLHEVCEKVQIPVFAIGGITKDKVKEIMATGAKGYCIMSEAMTCSNPQELTKQYYL